MLSVVVVDERQLDREALQGMLQYGTESEFRIWAVASPSDNLTPDTGQPDVLVLNLGVGSISDESGREAIRAIRAQLPEIPIMAIFESDGSAATGLKVMTAGIRGYCPASVSLELFSAALRLVAAGGIFVPPELMPDFLSLLISAEIWPGFSTVN